MKLVGVVLCGRVFYCGDFFGQLFFDGWKYEFVDIVV